MGRSTGEWLAAVRGGDGGPVLELVCEDGGPRPERAERDGVTVVLDGVLEGRPRPAEALLELFLRDGEAVLGRLRGHFSALVWLPARGELLALRDPLGVRPLYFAPGQHGVAVSPFMDLLLRQPGVRRDPDPMVLLGQMVLGLAPRPDETPFAGVRRVPAGHLVAVRGARAQLRRVWAPKAPPATRADAAEEFAAVLEATVGRLVGRRAGVFLSGGLDSATIAAAASRTRPTDEPPVAMALFNQAPASAEEPTQRAVAGALGLELVGGAFDELVPPGELLRRSLSLASASAWPPGPGQAAADVLARRAIAGGCDVLLTGDGGDELLLPFGSWAAERIARLDVAALAALVRASSYSNPGSTPRGLARALGWHQGVRPHVRGAATRALAALDPARLRRLRGRRFAAALPGWLALPAERSRELGEWFVERHPELSASGAHREEKRALVTAAFTSAHMEHQFATGRRLGVEILSPLWEVDLVELLLHVPPRRLIAGGRAKALARDYLAPELPFVERWPPKTFGDPEIGRLVEREGRELWRATGGLEVLGHLSIFDAERVERWVQTGSFGPGSPDPVAAWELMALESWLRSRLHWVSND